jgi:biofilm PGA synthesis protein PgaA
VDTFTTDVAKRAWAKKVTARQIAFNGKYRESEWWEYNFSLSQQRFSDDNERNELMMDYQRNIYLKNNWRMRLFLGLYAAHNSEWDNPDIDYFNPKNAWGLSVTHMTEQTVWKIYNHYFIHRLYLTVGNYKQHSYSNGLIGSLRYEQDFEFSDIHYLRWGVNVGTNVYDGENIGSIGLDLVWTLRF